MYAEHFGLRELPFCNTPDPRFFFATPDHEEALASLIYAVQERKGFVLLTGEIGAGKTLVSRMMLRHFEERVASAVIHHLVSDAADLLQAIAAEFGLPGDSTSSSAVVRRLHDFLLERYAQDTPVVLVLDEAQNLPRSAFEQLRMIGNLEADQAKLLQICFVGQPELQEVIRSRELRQLRQRIFRSFHLPPLNRDLTEAYIRHRLEVAGAPGQAVFDMGSLDRIFVYSRGIPRVINTTCDNAMLSAYSSGRTNVDVSLIDSVISFDLPRPQARETVMQPEFVGPASASHTALPIRTSEVDDRRDDEIRELRAQLGHLRERTDSMKSQMETGHAARRAHADVHNALESSLRHAEHTLRRIDRACATINAGERRVQQLGSAVDGMAVLLGPLVAKVDEITSHASLQLIRAESTSARLDALTARAKRAGAELRTDKPQASADSSSHIHEDKMIRQKEAERQRVFAGLSDAVSNLRGAAQQLSTGRLPELLNVP